MTTLLWVKATNVLERFKNGERGATAAEYGLIIALIAAVIIVVVGTLGRRIQAAFQTLVNNM